MTLFLQTLISGQSWNAFSKSASSTAPADAVKKTNGFNNLQELNKYTSRNFESAFFFNQIQMEAENF